MVPYNAMEDMASGKPLIVSNNGKYGLINFSGKQLLECKYDKIEPIKYK